MKHNKNKSTVLAMLCLYLAFGLAAFFVYYFCGSRLGLHSDKVDYTFKDSGKAGEEIEISNIEVTGGAAVEETVEAPVEAPAEAPVEEVITGDDTKKFYSFEVATEVNSLRIRREPNEDAKILGNFPKSTTGYILVKGNEWSLVTDGKKTGYCFNEYLQMTEISVDELPDFYPEEYKTQSSEEINY